MSPLLPFAQMLAADPPTEVYREIMKWDAASHNNQNYVDEWKTRCDQYGEEAATYFVGAICDLTAMSMMMVAAGVKRIEAMKASLRALQQNQSGLVVGNENAADRIYFYRSANDAAAFETLLTNWCLRKGSSVVQFKFLAKGDWHTFALERVHEENKDPEFLVYQSYQNVYRLQDFLGLGTPAAQTNHMRVVWADIKDGEKLVYGNKVEKFINDNLTRIDNTAKHIGCASKLDTATLEQRVITPLKGMLAGDIANASYVKMSGSPAKGRVGASFMAVLMCDTVSPDTFKTNYADLRKASGLTMYPECG